MPYSHSTYYILSFEFSERVEPKAKPNQFAKASTQAIVGARTMPSKTADLA